MTDNVMDNERASDDAAVVKDDPVNAFWDKNLVHMEPSVEKFPSCSMENGTVIQPAREIPVFRTCDVLVVGGGIAGWAAATAAAKAGAKTIMAERDESLGGLWSNGGVLVLLATGFIYNGKFFQTARGLTDDLIGRLERMGHAVTPRGADDRMYFPVADPEALKIALEELLNEAGAEILYRCHGVDAIMDGTAVRGFIFETRAGRQAILAKQVVDASGDGDVIFHSGAAYRQYRHGVGFTYRIGGFSHFSSEAYEAARAAGLWFGGDEPDPDNKWYGIFGVSTDPFDVAAMSKLMTRHRAEAWKSAEDLRKIKGCESAHLIWTATQVGLRGARTLDGVKSIDRAWAAAGKDEGDTIAWMGADGRSRCGSRVPYGCLVPKTVDNLLVAGRMASCSIDMVDLFRLIAPCLVTGQAAGVAAAVAVKLGKTPRETPVSEIQKVLLGQGALLTCQSSLKI